MRICRSCKTEKYESEFHFSHTRKDGLSPYCKKCKSEKARLYREKFSKEIKIRKKEYAEKNKEVISQKKKEKYQNNREKFLLKAAEYRSLPESKEKIKNYKQIYKENNKTVIRKYYNDRLKNDVEFRISHYYRARLNTELRKQSCSKKSSTCEIYGTTSKALYEYLLSLGYNKDTDHIDHIVPLSKFKLSNHNHLLVAGHYLNLQPLNANDNMSKKDSLPNNWQDKIYQICEVRNINPKPIIKYIQKGIKCQS